MPALPAPGEKLPHLRFFSRLTSSEFEEEEEEEEDYLKDYVSNSRRKLYATSSSTRAISQSRPSSWQEEEDGRTRMNSKLEYFDIDSIVLSPMETEAQSYRQSYFDEPTEDEAEDSDSDNLVNTYLSMALRQPRDNFDVKATLGRLERLLSAEYCTDSDAVFSESVYDSEEEEVEDERFYPASIKESLARDMKSLTLQTKLSFTNRKKAIAPLPRLRSRDRVEKDLKKPVKDIREVGISMAGAQTLAELAARKLGGEAEDGLRKVKSFRASFLKAYDPRDMTLLSEGLGGALRKKQSFRTSAPSVRRTASYHGSFKTPTSNPALRPTSSWRKDCRGQEEAGVSLESSSWRLLVQRKLSSQSLSTNRQLSKNGQVKQQEGIDVSKPMGRKNSNGFESTISSLPLHSTSLHRKASSSSFRRKDGVPAISIELSGIENAGALGKRQEGNSAERRAKRDSANSLREAQRISDALVPEDPVAPSAVKAVRTSMCDEDTGGAPNTGPSPSSQASTASLSCSPSPVHRDTNRYSIPSSRPSVSPSKPKKKNKSSLSYVPGEDGRIKQRLRPSVVHPPYFSYKDPRYTCDSNHERKDWTTKKGSDADAEDRHDVDARPLFREKSALMFGDVGKQLFSYATNNPPSVTPCPSEDPVTQTASKKKEKRRSAFRTRSNLAVLRATNSIVTEDTRPQFDQPSEGEIGRQLFTQATLQTPARTSTTLLSDGDLLTRSSQLRERLALIEQQAA